jgi:hypothetical protein
MQKGELGAKRPGERGSKVHSELRGRRKIHRNQNISDVRFYSQCDSASLPCVRGIQIIIAKYVRKGG